jgi:homoserine kinase
MEVSFKDEPGITLSSSAAYNLPTIPEDNVAGASLLALMEAYEKPVGFHVYIDKQIKPGNGLGSSAVVQVLLLQPIIYWETFLVTEDLVVCCMVKKVASGVKHADNITPCTYGGVTLIRSIFPLDIVTLDAPPLFVLSCSSLK